MPEATQTNKDEVSPQLFGCLQYFLTYRTNRAELYDIFRPDSNLMPRVSS
jgi:hypothetical protein